MCDWLTEKAYQKWYYIEYGATGRKLPSTRTIYRSQAEEKEKLRLEMIAESGEDDATFT